MARIRIAAIIGGCVLVISGAVLATRGEGDAEVPESQSAPVDESIYATGDSGESESTDLSIGPRTGPEASTSTSTATEAVAEGGGQSSSSQDVPETTMSLSSSPTSLGPVAPETTSVSSDLQESDGVNTPSAAPETPSTTSREEQVPRQESPTPITVIVPPSTTTTSPAIVPAVTCSVTVSPLEVTQPTSSTDRQVMVATEVESAEPLPAVWMEIRWETQIRRGVIELNPYGLGRSIIPAPGTGPVTAKIFINSDFAEIHRRCAS